MSNDNDARDYVPEQFLPKYWKVLIEVHPCVRCAAPTTEFMPSRLRGPFPHYTEASFEAQMKRAGMRQSVEVGYENFCEQCVTTEAIRLCALCGQMRTTDQIEESIGYPKAEHLCKQCFETATAKVWAEKHDQLWQKHRYDFD